VVSFYHIAFVSWSRLACSVDVLQGVPIGLENELNMLQIGGLVCLVTNSLTVSIKVVMTDML
jgi:hypothetical protein